MQILIQWSPSIPFQTIFPDGLPPNHVSDSLKTSRLYKEYEEKSVTKKCRNIFHELKAVRKHL